MVLLITCQIGGGASAEESAGVAAGIGEALITTATGMVVAIMALLVFRTLVTLPGPTDGLLSEVGNELELIYRQSLV